MKPAHQRNLSALIDMQKNNSSIPASFDNSSSLLTNYLQQKFPAVRLDKELLQEKELNKSTTQFKIR